jgi:hypothetical protein
MTAHRVRWFFGFGLVHVSHPHPIRGTPWEVPVPRKTSWPVMSLVRTAFGTAAF